MHGSLAKLGLLAFPFPTHIFPVLFPKENVQIGKQQLDLCSPPFS
jgi:hypothetical protein